MNHKKLLSQT